MSENKKVNKFILENLENIFSSLKEGKIKQEIPLSANFSINISGRFLRAEFEMPQKIFPPDLTKWLSLQEITQKLYWCERDVSYEIAGLGYADLISGGPAPFNALNNRLGIKSSKEDPTGHQDEPFLPLRYFGAVAFNAEDGVEDEWKTFGNSYFFVPKLEFVNFRGKKIFAANILLEDTFKLKNNDFEKEAQQLKLMVDNLDFNSAANDSGSSIASIKTAFRLQVKKRSDYPTKKAWIKNVNSAIKTFDSSMLEKIVLSRKTVFKTAAPINPLDLLDTLRRVNIRTFNFCFQTKSRTAFLGCSPELLYCRTYKRLYSEAVAGTVTSGSTLKEEKFLASKLLDSEKDGEEYQFVYDSIKKDLSSIGTGLNVESEKAILKLSYAQHIISRFDCNIKDGIDDGQIINVLHPTPAVGGFPKQGIKQHIKKYESFSRGFYAGPVGWISADCAEFVVGIRTGLVNNNLLTLFSGAGIVKKSVAEMEWEEIENKIKPFLGLMQF